MGEIELEGYNLTLHTQCTFEAIVNCCTSFSNKLCRSSQKK